MKLRVSSRAQRETDRIDAWWRKNRPAAPTLFLRELVYVVELSLHSPTLGTAYEAEQFNGPVRRVLLERSLPPVLRPARRRTRHPLRLGRSPKTRPEAVAFSP